MPRPSNPKIRARLREGAIDYVLQHGFTALSLRPVAKALKTNARMLIYHFGSREDLMREILMGLREREGAVIRQWFRKQKTPQGLVDFLRWHWRRMSAPEARPALVLIFELYALALRDPESYPGVLTDPIAYWRGLAAKTGVREKRDAEATLLLAVTRGLLLDMAATGDRVRVGKALKMFADRMDQAGAQRRSYSRG